jgi:polysaccharide export outer membrane protein
MMVSRGASLAVLLAVPGLVLGGCVNRLPPSVSQNPQTFAAPDTPDRSSVGANYRLGALDTITVSVFQVADVSGDYQIDPTGNINMPLIGGVDAEGKTLAEVQSAIRTSLGARYLQNPDVRVEIKSAVSQRFTVEGAVNQPGIYPLTGDLTLVQALATAKGPNGDAVVSRVVIFRKIRGQRQAAAFDMRLIRSGRMPDPTIYGNDVVVVDGSRVRQSLRDAMTGLGVLGVFGVL